MWYGFFADEAGDGSSKPHADPLSAEDEKPKARPEAQALPDQEEGELEKASVGGEMGDALQMILPWMTSFLVHIGIVLMTMFVVWTVIPAIEEDSAPIIPSARLSANPGGGSVSVSQSAEASVQATQSVVRNVKSESVGTNNDATLDSVNETLGAGEAVELIGVAGGGGESSSKLAPFGVTNGTSSETKFFGVGVGSGDGGGNARKIIFCVDASGSLISGLPFVIKELKKSINGLSDKQEFTVIFFQDGEPLEAPPVGWKPANAENKRKVSEWVAPEAGNIIPRGKTDPVKALKLAMKYKPQLLIVLSDNITGYGEYEVDRADLMKLFADSNKPDSKGELRMKINTLQFLYPDPLNTLGDIAKQNGGISQFITNEDLGLQ